MREREGLFNEYMLQVRKHAKEEASMRAEKVCYHVSCQGGGGKEWAGKDTYQEDPEMKYVVYIGIKMCLVYTIITILLICFFFSFVQSDLCICHGV